MGHTLVFKWGVSRGRNTYGYTICSLYADGAKVASCNGGGYDMKGTCLGNWVAKRFHKELLKLDIPYHYRNGEKIQEYYGLSFHDPNFDPGKVEIDGRTVEELEAAGESLGLERYQQFYKASSRVPTEWHTVPIIDGACGFSSVETILNALGYQLKWVHDSAKETIYILSRKEEKCDQK